LYRFHADCLSNEHAFGRSLASIELVARKAHDFAEIQALSGPLQLRSALRADAEKTQYRR
jgi:hypothetical protein